MKTGIIILNYNDVENTKKMINQIKDYRCLSKIVIVDNCSKDNSIEELKKYESHKIVLIEAKKNKGYAAGNNLGLKYLAQETKCELAIISNPDVIVEENVIVQLIETMKKNPEISFLGPKVLELGYISKGWKLPTFKADLVSNITYFHRFGKNMLKYPNDYYQEPLTKVDVIHGCFFIARLKDFKKINYFDSHTFLYYEENILGKKAQAANMQTMVNTTVAVTHNLSKSVDKSLNKVKKYQYLKQSQFYYEKKYNHLNFLGMFLLKIFYYISLAIAYIAYWF